LERAGEALISARHRTPDLSLNVYAKTRDKRPSELAEKIGESVFSKQQCAKSVHSKQVESKEIERKFLIDKPLAE
jgi:hypothetical protein